MAGLGHKTFTRETLGSVEVQGYLMDQVVAKFASAAARNASITAPTEGMMVTLDDTNQVERYDGATWRSLGRHAGGWLTNVTTDVNGLYTVAHGLGVVPTFAHVSLVAQPTGALDAVMEPMVWTRDATNLVIRTWRNDGTGGTRTAFQTSFSASWSAHAL